MRKLVFFIALLLVGCGSRKVEKHFKSVIEDVKIEEVEQMQTKELTLSKEQSSSLVHKLNARADSIKADANGNITLYNPVIESNKEDIKNNLDTSKLVEANTDKSKVEDSFKEEKEKDKNVEREQYSWWGILWPFGMVLGVGYCFNRWAVPWLKKVFYTNTIQ
ncbi:hypothetical protein [Myroides odoratimimus]|uniref:hypothetical protein n=1 Tax=Myroides odoratimimus TaxID=76832 RepID=UPI002577A7F7|nr:hypothetical protein [Myroides odoratimimus]MDM1065781.1 hypothetical protein [Myroides odoratimimus]MDM1464010.1 hypothetical protein [Myroides odoratimimus]MDM1473928.1 hypothetical protein [Myroides odoratimimus]